MASPLEIEREVEDRRANVENTLDALKRKMSVGQIVDEFGGYVGTEDAKLALRNVGRQARDNPLALGLVGIGVAWLMFGGRSGDGYAARDAYGWTDRRREPGPLRPVAPTAGVRHGSAYGSAYEPEEEREGALSRVGGAVSGAAHAVGDAVSDAAHAVGDRLSDASHRVAEAASDSGERLRSAGAEGRRRARAFGDEVGGHLPSGRGMAGSWVEAIERQPLMTGAFALAAGVALGAALPATRTEDRWLGEGRDELAGAARDAARDVRDRAVGAAEAGMRAASEAAREQGLTPQGDGDTLAAKVETVVRAGVEETRRTLGSEDASARDETPPPRG